MDPNEPTRAESTQVRPGKRVADRYLLETVLGTGGMGTVHRARDEKLGRVVALKRLRSEGSRGSKHVDRLLVEARAAARLDHPNVVRIYDASEDDQGPFLVFELVDGESLASLLQRRGVLPVEKAVAIASDVTAGLAEAHAAGIIHRDLKAANVLVTREGRAKIADFGISRSIDAPRLTSDGVVVGTPSHLAPELLHGGEAGERSDLFALGCLLHEMLSGTSPFHAEGVQEVLARILAGTPSELPEGLRREWPDLARLVASLLARDPEERPATAATVGAALHACAARHGARRRRARLAIAAGLLAAGALVPVVVVLAQRGASPERVPPPPPPRGVQDVAGVGPGSGHDDVVRERLGPTTLPDYSFNAAFAPFGIEVEEVGEEVWLSGSASAIRNARQLLRVTGHDHQPAPADPATGLESRNVSFHLTRAPLGPVIRALSIAGEWPLVWSDIERGSTLTVAMGDVPPRAALLSVLDSQGLQVVEHGRVSMVLRPQDAAALRDRAQPVGIVLRPSRARPDVLVSALRIAAADVGEVHWSERLQAVVMTLDRGALPALTEIWGVLDGLEPQSVVPIDVGFVGDGVSIDAVDADFLDMLRLIVLLSGMNVMLDPAAESSSRITVRAEDVRWDNLLEATLLTRDLTWHVRSNVLRVLPGDEPPDEVRPVALRLERADPAFVERFASWLGPEGHVVADSQSGTIVFSGRRADVEAFRRFVLRLDSHEADTVPVAGQWPSGVD